MCHHTRIIPWISRNMIDIGHCVLVHALLQSSLDLSPAGTSQPIRQCLTKATSLHVLHTTHTLTNWGHLSRTHSNLLSLHGHSASWCLLFELWKWWDVLGVLVTQKRGSLNGWLDWFLVHAPSHSPTWRSAFNSLRLVGDPMTNPTQATSTTIRLLKRQFICLEGIIWLVNRLVLSTFWLMIQLPSSNGSDPVWSSQCVVWLN